MTPMPYAVLHRQFLNSGPDELRIRLQHGPGLFAFKYRDGFFNGNG